MFGGHNDNAAPADDSTTVTPPAGTTLPAPAADDSATAAPGYDSNGFLTTDPSAASTGTVEPAASAPDSTATVTPSTPEPSTDDTSTTDAPGAPPTAADTPVDSTTTNTSTTSVFSADPPAPLPTTPAAIPTPDGDSDDLLNIKQQALQQLSPLVGHLDQSPEEKFRTTMMMIQAADDQSLIKDAYAAAQQITDEKTKAQALLDIVNEINYFSQNHDAPVA